MKRTLIAAALALLVLAGCNKEEGVDSTSNPAASSPSGSAGGLSTDPAGSSTPPGAADSSAGNQSTPNTTDSMPTQEQLDPAPAQSPTGSTTPQ